MASPQPLPQIWIKPLFDLIYHAQTEKNFKADIFHPNGSWSFLFNTNLKAFLGPEEYVKLLALGPEEATKRSKRLLALLQQTIFTIFTHESTEPLTLNLLLKGLE